MGWHYLKVLSSTRAIAIWVGSTTYVTEVLSTPTVNVVAAFVLLHVQFAFWALLPLVLFNHLEKSCFV